MVITESNSLKFEHFLTPTIESNMLKYIASKSNDRNIVAKNTIHLVTVRHRIGNSQRKPIVMSLSRKDTYFFVLCWVSQPIFIVYACKTLDFLLQTSQGITFSIVLSASPCAKQFHPWTLFNGHVSLEWCSLWTNVPTDSWHLGMMSPSESCLLGLLAPRNLVPLTDVSSD